MMLEKFKSVHKTRLNSFLYVPDREQYGLTEHWPDREQIPAPGTIFKGDCDDFAHACYWDLEDMGIESNLIYCKTETGGGHLVCECGGYILDNRQRTVLAIADISYTWISAGRPGGKWYLIKT
jgi:predicted transglutaminase-like cysteine proteinase